MDIRSILILNNRSPIKKKLLPIVVDLDGTLLLTDTLFESLVKIFHKHPSEVLNLPFWLAQGKANLKKNLSEKIALNPETLPFNKELLEWRKKNKTLGHQLILCTAADKKIANTKVVNDLGQFKQMADVIVANRVNEDIHDMDDKIYSRDLFVKIEVIGRVT